MIKLRLLKWGDNPGQLGGPQCNQEVLIRGRQYVEESEGKGNVTTVPGVGVMCFEHGGTGHEPKNTAGPWKLEKTGKWILP